MNRSQWVLATAGNRHFLSGGCKSPPAGLMLKACSVVCSPASNPDEAGPSSLCVRVTLLCAVLSLWVVPAERQRRAVLAIEAVGGKVEYVEREATQRCAGKSK